MTITLDDRELVAEVTRLAHGERQSTAALIAHLAELYARRLHERAGYGSLFTYCMSVLRLSESAAYDRMKAAKVARRYPSVLDRLADGRVNLTSVRLVAPHLTAANHEDLFAALEGRTKRQVQEELARRFPQPDVRASVRKLPSRVTTAPAAAVPCAAPADRNVVEAAPPPTSPPPRPIEATTSEAVRPLSPDRFRITFTGGASLCRKLDLARDLLRHAVPSGDPAKIVERALDALVEGLIEKKFAVTARARASHGQQDDSRHVPAAVKRTVYVRDAGRCAYLSPEGRRCGQRALLEFHHLQPYAAGGKATVENISLRCWAHNRYEAEAFYGPAREYGGIGVPERDRSGGTCAGGETRAEAAPDARVRAATFSFRNESRAGVDAGPGVYTPGHVREHPRGRERRAP